MHTEARDQCRRMYEDYLPVVLGYFRRNGFDSEEARDLAHDTFLRAFKGLPTFRADASEKTWLLTIAKHVGYNKLRAQATQKRQAVQVPLDEEDALSDRRPAGTPYENVRRREVREHLEVGLARLPVQVRRCWELHVLRGLKYREIAVLLKIEVGTVKSNIHEARRRLKPFVHQADGPAS